MEVQSIWRNTAQLLKGSSRRTFIADVVRSLGRSGQRFAEKCLELEDHPHDLDQALDLGVVDQAANGVRGLAVFNGGGLLGMPQQAMVKQQAKAGRRAPNLVRPVVWLG